VLALTEVRGEDKSEFNKLLSAVKEGYTERHETARRQWGGGIMGAKAIARVQKRKEADEKRLKI
jgi:large subunit ribosomal protein L7Ae